MLHRIARCKKFVLIAGLGIGMLAGGAALTRAGDNDCDKRIHQAEEKLQREIDRHGEHSPEAERSRHQLEEVRKGCADRR
jgi:hypothetical protein